MVIDLVEKSVPPKRSKTQIQDSLDKANSVRTRRSQLKLQVYSGRITVAQLIEKPPEYIETMKLRDLLLAQKSVGEVKAEKFLRAHLISPAKTIGGLSPRQRSEIVRALQAA